MTDNQKIRFRVLPTGMALYSKDVSIDVAKRTALDAKLMQNIAFEAFPPFARDAGLDDAQIRRAKVMVVSQGVNPPLPDNSLYSFVSTGGTFAISALLDGKVVDLSRQIQTHAQAIHSQRDGRHERLLILEKQAEVMKGIISALRASVSKRDAELADIRGASARKESQIAILLTEVNSVTTLRTEVDQLRSTNADLVESNKKLTRKLQKLTDVLNSDD